MCRYACAAQSKDRRHGDQLEGWCLINTGCATQPYAFANLVSTCFSGAGAIVFDCAGRTDVFHRQRTTLVAPVAKRGVSISTHCVPAVTMVQAPPKARRTSPYGHSLHSSCLAFGFFCLPNSRCPGFHRNCVNILRNGRKCVIDNAMPL